MARGWDPVAERAQAAAEQQKRFDEGNVPMIFSKEIRAGNKDGGPLVVRFLEQDQDVYSFERHPFLKPGNKYPDHETCLSEVGVECPACRAGIRSTRKGAYNLIVRDRAVLRKGADGKAIKNPDGSFIVDGYADQLVVWECSNTTANVIRQADHQFKGLMSRDLLLTLTGNDKNPYALYPVDVDGGPQPMSAEDLALAAKKFDLNVVFKPPTQQEMASLVAKYGANSGASGPAQGMPSAVPAVANNPYAAGATIPADPFAAAQQAPPQTQS